MATTRSTLQTIANNLDESLGVRVQDTHPQLAPLPQSGKEDRAPLRNFGTVPVDRIIPDPNQPRQRFSEAALDRLANSIREQGQMTPIRVRWSNAHDRWLIVFGERRWRATKRAGLPTIECCFHEKEVSKSEILEQQLIENCLREDLQPLEEAKAFASLMEINGWNGKQVAEALRVPSAKISRTLALLRLPADIQEQVNEGKISARSAYEISKLDDDKAQRALARKASAGTLTHEQAALAVRQRRNRPTQRPRGVSLTFKTETGWKVTVSANRKGTYAEVEQALVLALEEVRHRINNNVQIY